MTGVYVAAGALIGSGIVMTPSNSSWACGTALGLAVVFVTTLIDRYVK